MPTPEDSRQSTPSSRNDEFEDIEILKNLLEIRAKLRQEKSGIDTELE